ncbi:TNT domain-containing protein [Xanthomonas prunicola]|uniref:TNT domain-containing protein n=1 Tax=Xanthomonas prunicola TaxID=2053930 RepID=UPI001FAFB81F|nr:TNT domain-containing protein [Xanthomonas prunicola]
MAGDCSNQALASAAWNGSIPLSVATADSALRAALGMGAGTVGATGRVWEMVTGVAELANGMSPAGQVGKSIDQLAYMWGNGYAATAEKNFNDAKSALNAIKTGISGYAEDLAFAAYTNTHGSWDIYDIAKAGAIGGKVSVDVFSLVAPELYVGKGGVAAKAATSMGDAFKADNVIDYINSLRPGKIPAAGARGPIANPTAAQAATAEKLKVDPRWVKPDGSPDWPTKENNGFADGFDAAPKVIELGSGKTFDRFGGRFDENGSFTDRGNFVAPPDVPFDQRALPSSSME